MQYSEQELNALGSRVASAKKHLDDLKRARTMLDGVILAALEPAKAGYNSFLNALIGICDIPGGMSSDYSDAKSKTSKLSDELDEAIAYAASEAASAEDAYNSYGTAMQAERAQAAAREGADG